LDSQKKAQEIGNAANANDNVKVVAPEDESN
jgi:hypothetical protein